MLRPHTRPPFLVKGATGSEHTSNTRHWYDGGGRKEYHLLLENIQDIKHHPLSF